MTPGSIDQTFQIAVEHHQAGRLGEAERICRQILVEQPAHAEAMHLLAMIAYRTGKNEVALDLFRRAIALRPNFPEALSNLGLVLRQEGQLGEAIAAYRQLIAFAPNSPAAHCNMGIALTANKQLDEAVAEFQRAIALDSNLPEVFNNLGIALKEKGLFDEAIAVYRHAIGLRPKYAGAFTNLGNALKEKRKLDEAIAAHRRAIEFQPDFADAHNNLGFALNAKGQLDEALAAYRRAIALRPNFPGAFNNLGHCLMGKGQIDEAIAAYRRAISLRPSYVEAHSNLVYSLYFHPDYDAQMILAEHRGWARVHAERLKPEIRAHQNERSPDRKLKIGFLSPDFCDHPVGRSLLPLFENRDPQQIEIVCYSDVRLNDATNAKLKSVADQWVDVRGMNDAAVAGKIAGEQIDILVDTTLHTAGSRLLVFAREPAPVQLTMLGPPMTVGLSTMHYRLTDPYLDPPGVSDGDYSEASIRLADCFWIYHPPMFETSVNGLPAQSGGYVSFGCLNQFSKVTRPVLQAWLQVLQAVPNSRLTIQSQPGDHLEPVRKLFQDGGISPDRVRFVGSTSREKYFLRYHELDICFDPFPFNGHTSSMDALWMGVPTVTLRGKTAVGRGGVSILSNVGLTDWIAENREQYVSIAAKMAGDLPRLAELRGNLRARMRTSPLMDGPRFTRNVEAALRQAWRNWCARGGKSTLQS
jgi:protein O-GlcNAc transferase